MKKNKILIGVISIMFAGIITLGIIECNNSNTKDNDKLFIGCLLYTSDAADD